MGFDVEIKPNKYHLDQDVIDQVSLYEECTDKWADAILERDKAKENLTVIKAEVDDEIRKNPKEYGWSSENKSPTEAWFAARIVLDERVRQATTEHLEAIHRANILSGNKETLEHRKKALEILTELYKGQYFVAVSRSDGTYKEKVSSKGKEAQVEALESSERMRKRRAL